jgi:hypothetical protein
MVEPRTRATRVNRDISKMDKAHVGDESFPETCPRCGWPCTHLVTTYWGSPFNEWGGLCSECVKGAVFVFDRDGWPADPHEVKHGPASEAVKLWKEED